MNGQSPRLALAAQRMADLLASIRDVGPSEQAGIVSGPGNQGSSSTANLQGHAGTSDTFLSVPRQLKQGRWGAMPQ